MVDQTDATWNQILRGCVRLIPRGEWHRSGSSGEPSTPHPRTSSEWAGEWEHLYLMRVGHVKGELRRRASAQRPI